VVTFNKNERVFSFRCIRWMEVVIFKENRVVKMY